MGLVILNSSFVEVPPSREILRRQTNVLPCRSSRLSIIPLLHRHTTEIQALPSMMSTSLSLDAVLSVEDVVSSKTSWRIVSCALTGKCQPLALSLSSPPSATKLTRDAGIARTPNTTNTFRYPNCPTAAGPRRAPTL